MATIGHRSMVSHCNRWRLPSKHRNRADIVLQDWKVTHMLKGVSDLGAWVEGLAFSSGVDGGLSLRAIAMRFWLRHLVTILDVMASRSRERGSYEIPDHAIAWSDFADRVNTIRSELATAINSGPHLSYRAPWASTREIARGSLDLVFSQAVLDTSMPLQERIMPWFVAQDLAGMASHVIDFSAHHLPPSGMGIWPILIGSGDW